MKPKKAIISDNNSELICTWNSIKNDLNPFIDFLNVFFQKHSEDFYYELRDGKVKDEKDIVSEIFIASKFVYINKTCFNGLYRKNSKGIFNVPFNKRINIKLSTIYEKNNLENISEFLNKNDVKIFCKSYQDILNMAEEGDFVFVDPPYDFENTKTGFVSYCENKWTKENTVELINLLKELDEKNVKWMFTNHDTSLINSELKKYKKFVVPVNRCISSDAEKRKFATNEVIFINYQIDQKSQANFNFEFFFKTLKKTSYVLEDYVSWNKIKINLNNLDIYMNDLNYLIVQDEVVFWKRAKEIFDSMERKKSISILPLFLAKKEDKCFFYISNDGKEKEFNYLNWDLVKEFFELSGLKNNLFLSKEFKSVGNYLLGVEVGLSNNDKKNKSGKFMSEMIKNIFNNNRIEFKSEVLYSKILNNSVLRDKKFDFVFNFGEINYCVEVNFFNSGGSKINSEMDRFIDLSKRINSEKNLKFVWITDGPGLLTIKPKLKTAFQEIGLVFNIQMFEEFIKNLLNIW